MKFFEICDEARCSPDSPLSYEQIAERYTRFTGKGMTGETVFEAYKEHKKQSAESTVIASWEIRNGKLRKIK